LIGGQESSASASFFESIGAPQQLREKFSAPDWFDVFPENWAAVRVFSLMSTQWRFGMNGAVGLDYAALPVVEARAGVANEDLADLFWAVREMELETLKVFSERRNG